MVLAKCFAGLAKKPSSKPLFDSKAVEEAAALAKSRKEESEKAERESVDTAVKNMVSKSMDQAQTKALQNYQKHYRRQQDIILALLLLLAAVAAVTMCAFYYYDITLDAAFVELRSMGEF